MERVSVKAAILAAIPSVDIMLAELDVFKKFGDNTIRNPAQGKFSLYTNEELIQEYRNLIVAYDLMDYLPYGSPEDEIDHVSHAYDL